MTPEFQLLADGEDVTAIFADRLIDLDVRDEDGLKSDRLSVTLDDRDSRIVIPEHGARLELALGHRETGLTHIGSYVVERRSGRLNPRTVTIEAQAADMAGTIRAPKTRSWRDRTLGDIVRTVAGEAGLQAVIGDDIAQTAYALVAQTSESDLHLITRLARVLDATAKPADGRLVVTRRGTGRTTAGEAIQAVPIFEREMDGCDWTLEERSRYASVTAEWSEFGTATLHKVTVGDGEPEQRLRHPFGSRDEAARAARAALERAERGNTQVRAELATFRPALFAGGVVEFPDLRPELEGRYTLRSVSHRLAGSLRTSIDCEIAP